MMETLLYYDRLLSHAISLKDLNTKKSDSEAEGQNEEDVKRSIMLRKVLIMLEYSGHGVPWIGITVLMIYVTKDMKVKQFYCNMLLALLLDLVIVGLLKVIIRRQRPVYNIDDMFATVSVDRYSFPSGHSTRAAMVAVLLSSFWTSTICITLGYTWACAVAVSRVMLGRHHVSDVVMGVVIGYFQYLVVVHTWLNEEMCQRLTSF